MNISRLFATVLLVFGASSVALAEADLKIYGSNTVGAEMAPALVKGWLKKQGYGQIKEEKDGSERLITGANNAGKQISVELDAQGSSTGFRALAADKANVGMSSRPIKGSEVKKLASKGHCDTPDCEFVAALDGIAVIVNAKNSISQMSKSTLERIFSGEVTNWSEVGGKAGPIHVFALDENSGTFDTFKNLVLGKASLVGGAKRDASHTAVSDMVSKDANAIGFVGLPFVNESKALSVSDGEAQAIAPSPFSVATEDYVLARRLYFYRPEITATPLATEFVEYAVSAEGQEIAKDVGFISQEILAHEVSLPADSPKEYIELTKGAKRLSLNFRFKPGTAELDNKAVRDVKRLKKFMNKPENRGSHLMLFGFADSSESMPIVALQLSTARADNAADILVKEGLRPAKVRGYGSSVGVASNDTKEGRYKNRRVEVWVQ